MNPTDTEYGTDTLHSLHHLAYTGLDISVMLIVAGLLIGAGIVLYLGTLARD